MKIVRYLNGTEIAFGCLLDDDRIQRLSASPFTGTPTPLEDYVRRENVKLLAPVERPRIFGAGYNYMAHIKEAGTDTPQLPALFYKPETCLAGPDEPIIYPAGGENVHYEAELCVVIGKAAREVSEADAPQYILGYTCGNDVSDRVVQMKEMKFGCLFAGKAFDSFAPLGPVIQTDLDPSNVTVIGRLNGEVKQKASTSDLLFSVPKLVSYMSSFMTLFPGDVIMTGTASGVGPLKPGDVFEVEIEGIGILRNPVIAKPA